MPDAKAQEPPPQQQKRLNPHLERFLRAFEGSIESADRIEKAAEAIITAVVHEEDGLIPAIDEMIDEMRGLREDLRAIAEAGGLRAAFRKMRDL